MYSDEEEGSCHLLTSTRQGEIPSLSVSCNMHAVEKVRINISVDLNNAFEREE